MDKEKKRKTNSYSNCIVSFLSLPSDSQSPRVRNIKSIKNLNNTWLRIGAASFSSPPEFFPPDTKPLKHSTNSFFF
jgi:hypothetical protein